MKRLNLMRWLTLILAPCQLCRMVIFADVVIPGKLFDSNESISETSISAESTMIEINFISADFKDNTRFSFDLEFSTDNGNTWRYYASQDQIWDKPIVDGIGFISHPYMIISMPFLGIPTLVRIRAKCPTKSVTADLTVEGK